MTSQAQTQSLDGVPASLIECPQWVCWKYMNRAGKQTKVPVNPKTGGSASTTDQSTWASFEDAVHSWQSRGYAGVGFVFSPDDPFCGIDLDDCIDEAGNIAPAALAIIESLNSYTEVSPSGRGVKVFITGHKPKDAKCKSKIIDGFKEAEVYDRDRFFTVTGQHVPDTPNEVEDRQTQLDELCARLWPKKVKPSREAVPSPSGFGGDDDALIKRASAAKNGELFNKLWAGNISLHDDDESAADLSLCNLLAFWTGKDQTRMDRLFRRSGLYRDKWDEKRGAQTYGEMTIAKAIEDCHDTYSPRGLRRSEVVSSGDPDGPETDPVELCVALGQRDPETGRLVLSPSRTLPTAKAYVAEFNQHPEGRTLLSYGCLLMEWRSNRYTMIEDEWVRQRLIHWLHESQRYVFDKSNGGLKLVDFESNPSTVKQALETIRSYVHLPASTTPPCWLDNRRDRPPVLEILPCKSMSLHIPTCRVLQSTPALFTTNALDFDYDSNAKRPDRWIEFLEQLFGEDLESVELLQEWMGYCLTGDTSQQKMLLLVGPKRSGKGTIGRILKRLVGSDNIVGPTTGSLAGNFGLQPLIGKSLAIVSDARFSGENIATVIERLLCISGEDTLTIDRKYLGSVSMKLPTRFMFLTNELPRLNDSSTALAGRFLVLRLRTSFYGTEDTTLTDQLLAELPGILLWAIEGWKRLQQRGRFLQPKTGEDSIRDLEDLSSPVGAFIRDECLVGVGHRVWVDELYSAWKHWCEREGRNMVSTKQAFGRDLTAAASGVQRRRGSGQIPFYEGIRLRTEEPL